MVSDSAFYSQEMVEKTQEKGIELSFSALNGRHAPEGKLGADQFVIDPKAVTITKKKLIADRYRSLLGTAEHQALADFRAGVEGVLSVLRRVYRIDDLPVRGLVRTRIWDHLKIIAYNFKLFYGYCKRNGASPLSLAHYFRLFSRCFGFGQTPVCYR